MKLSKTNKTILTLAAVAGVLYFIFKKPTPPVGDNK